MNNNNAAIMTPARTVRKDILVFMDFIVNTVPRAKPIIRDIPQKGSCEPSVKVYTNPVKIVPITKIINAVKNILFAIFVVWC